MITNNNIQSKMSSKHKAAQEEEALPSDDLAKDFFDIALQKPETSM